MSDPINNLHMTSHGNMISVGWSDSAGMRFHVWLTVKDGEPIKPYQVRRERPMGHKEERATIYVNCPLHLGRYDEGYFKTRYRDAEAKTNADIVQRALCAAEEGEMLEAQREADREAEAQKKQAERTAYAVAIREALQAHADRVLADSASEHADTLQCLVAEATDDELFDLGNAIRWVRA